MKSLIITLLSLVLITGSSQARRLYSSGSGNWTSSSTWGGTYTPAAGDTITIYSGHTVQITSVLNYSGSRMGVIIFGTLNFHNAGAKLNMPSPSKVDVRSGGQITTTGSGGGASQIIKSGTNTLWTRGDGNVSGPTVLSEDGSGPLPVTLLSFNAQQTENRVIIKWNTASEDNNQFFTLERSDNGQAFTPVTRVESNLFSGNQAKEYFFTDYTPVSQKTLYRLSQTDFNGTTTYLSTISLNGTQSENIISSVYPNPVTDGIVNFTLPGNASSSYLVTIVSLDGKTVLNKQVSGGTQQLDFSTSVNHGIYIMKISAQDGTEAFTRLSIR